MRRPGASLAAAAPAGQRSPGLPVMRPVQPAAPGCIAVPARATMMHAAQRHQPHHRCIRSRRTMKSQVAVAAQRSGRPRAPQRRTLRRRQRVFTRSAECCIRCNSAPFVAGQSRMPELMQGRDLTRALGSRVPVARTGAHNLNSATSSAIATEGPFGCGSDGMSADCDLPPDRRDCALLSGDLRAVDRPRQPRLPVLSTAYLYITMPEVDILNCRWERDEISPDLRQG